MSDEARAPDVRSGDVPESAVLDLLESVDVCAGRSVHARDMIDLAASMRAARAFKLDVSFDFGPRRHARYSVNDKGEPQSFRARARRLLPALGAPSLSLQRFFEVAAPGVVQTTLALKWRDEEPLPDRVSLYYEELFRSPASERIRREVFALADAEAPPVPSGAEPVAVCIDHRGGEPVAVKTYDMFVERPDQPRHSVPAEMAAIVDQLPAHPISGTRRYMIATRHAPGGGLIGRKLLWMTEIHRPTLLPWVWERVDAWRARWGTNAHPDVSRAFDQLRMRWRHDAQAFLHPDLVCLNLGLGGPPELIVYVSIR